MPSSVRSENAPSYLNEEARKKKIQSEDRAISRALKILDARIRASEDVISSPETTVQYLQMRIGANPYETFGVLFLTNRHAVIDALELFRGTIAGASVYPREVARECIQTNAAAVILYHNHPSGNCEPSDADIRITRKLKEALNLIDVRVLDHIIVSGSESYSFAEEELI